jgi:hypothetical protein
MDETYPLPPSGMIRLTSEDAQVSIAGSDRQDVRIEVHYRISAAREKLTRFKYRVSAAQAVGELVVTEERQAGSQNFAYDEQIHAIKIELPRHAHVTVHEEDGTCAISGISGRVHLTMDDGDARLENCSGDITVSMDDGTVTQTNCATLKYDRR